MSEHTPTPWKVQEICSFTTGAPVELSIQTDDVEVALLDLAEADDEQVLRADAAFIVRAVNSHDALVEALKEASLQIEYLHEKFQPTGSGNGLLARINAALKDAE